jgi:hypothetical protein
VGGFLLVLRSGAVDKRNALPLFCAARQKKASEIIPEAFSVRN